MGWCAGVGSSGTTSVTAILEPTQGAWSFTYGVPATKAPRGLKDPCLDESGDVPRGYRLGVTVGSRFPEQPARKRLDAHTRVSAHGATARAA